MVPRLALQTLVENSVKYAVSPRREGASLVIAATRTNDRLRVRVTDDGPGFDDAQIPDGHGLALIRGRLEMLYGREATLSFRCTTGTTEVLLDVPAADA
jgi:LytS/YehU family sensor histidine kinase